MLAIRSWWGLSVSAANGIDKSLELLQIPLTAQANDGEVLPFSGSFDGSDGCSGDLDRDKQRYPAQFSVGSSSPTQTTHLPAATR